jgi:hypothetical protein
MDGDAGEIIERLARVEKSMRRYQAALAVVTVIAVAGLAGNPLLVGAEKMPEVIQAKSFAVVDDDGKVRAVLGSSGDDVGLAFTDRARIRRIVLSTSGDGASLILADKARKLRAVLATFGDDASLILSDKAVKPRARLAGYGAGLKVFDEAGRVRAALATSGDEVTLGLIDKAGKVRAALGTDDVENSATGSTEHRAASSLVLLNAQGRVLWEAP